MARDLKTNLLDDPIINVIRKFMIFADLSIDEIKKLLSLESEYDSRIAKLCSYNAGETVIKEGDFDCWSFWVIKGSYNVIQNGELVVNFSTPAKIWPLAVSPKASSLTNFNSCI